jgi:Tol biopolymer transport system component
MANPALSPDGSRIALDISDLKANNVDVWLARSDGSGNARFTFNPEEEVVGVWSRDGSLLAYRSNVNAGTGLFLKATTSLQREREIAQSPSIDDLLPNSWSADGQRLLLSHFSPSGSRLELLSIAGGKLEPFLSAKGSQSNGMISPDGKWVAYASDESGNWEIYVTTFPDAAGKWQVSRGGGTEPRWRGDCKEIFYVAPKGMLMAVSVDSENGLTTGLPAPLFQIHRRAPISSTDVFSYDVARDGKRFLVNRYVKPDQIGPLTIVLHAAAE